MHMPADSKSEARGSSGRVVLRAGPVAVTRVAWSASYAKAQHEHEEARVVVCLSGTLDERSGGTTHRHGPGSVFVREPRIPHSNRYQSGGVYLSIALHDEALAASITPRSRHLGVVPSVGPLAVNLSMEVLRGDSWSALASHGLALELLAALQRHDDAERARPEWLADVCAALREDRRRAWSLADVGRLVDVDPVRLSRTFRRCIGMTVGAYVRGLRVDEARRLIESGWGALGEIADEVGFCDQSHLNRAFRESTGTSPGEYRRRFVLASPRPNAADSF
jgi:AraC family transcriptional regulator